VSLKTYLGCGVDAGAAGLGVAGFNGAGLAAAPAAGAAAGAKAPAAGAKAPAAGAKAPAGGDKKK